MTKLIADDGRTHIESSLMRESLVDRRVIARTDSIDEVAILPDIVMVGIGGQSIFDRGKGAVLPLVAELGAIRDTRKHQIVLAVGGGARTRHTMSVALDLGLPVGGVALLVAAMEECNAVMLSALLAKHGSIVMHRDHFWELPLYMETNMLPIVISVPPYRFWEPPPEHDDIVPAHGSDFGMFVHAETLGVRRLIFVKDEDGLHDKDPKKHADAKPIRHITLDALMKDLPEELIVDKVVFSTWERARHIKHVQIINGLVPGELTRALAGEPVGTVIEKTS